MCYYIYLSVSANGTCISIRTALGNIFDFDFGHVLNDTIRLLKSDFSDIYARAYEISTGLKSYDYGRVIYLRVDNVFVLFHFSIERNSYSGNVRRRVFTNGLLLKGTKLL